MKNKNKKQDSDWLEVEVYQEFPSYGTSGCINWDPHKGKPKMCVGTVKYIMNPHGFSEFHTLIEVNDPYES